jgi:uncharacterized protein (UPF0261 family)
VPLRGISAVSGEGGPFFDPDADAALRAGLHETLAPSVEVRDRRALAMAARLDEYLGGTG